MKKAHIRPPPEDNRKKTDCCHSIKNTIFGRKKNGQYYKFK